VVKELFASTFPHNLRRLAEITRRMKRAIDALAAEEGIAVKPGTGNPDFFTFSLTESRPTLG
jgi:hypothetical protein